MDINYSVLKKFIVSIISFIIFYLILLFIFSKLGITPYNIKSFADLIGPVGIILVFLIMVFSVMSPFPDSPAALAAIILYGPFIGFLIILIGSFCGAILDFFIARKIGRKFFLSRYPIAMETINALTKKYGFEVFIFLRIFPIITLDIVSYGAAMTKIKFPIFALSTLLGLFPLALTYSIVGIGFENGDSRKIYLSIVFGFLILLIAIALANLYKKELKENSLEEIKNEK